MELNPAPSAGINDGHVTDSAPLVRALVVARLEKMWRACDPHLDIQVNESTGLVMRPDPRFVEAGIRIVDRLIDLYRLKVPQLSGGGSDQPDRELTKAHIMLQLEEMENRLQGRGEGS